MLMTLVAPTTEQLHIVEQLEQPPLASSGQAAVKQQRSSEVEASQCSQLKHGKSYQSQWLPYH